jgi:hypothetical protein
MSNEKRDERKRRDNEETIKKNYYDYKKNLRLMGANARSRAKEVKLKEKEVEVNGLARAR